MRVPALVEFLMPGRLLTTGCVAAAALAVAHAQQQPPTFGSTTRTIAVYATVTDPQGRLAPDLARDNFEVDDNGVKQELTVFSNDVQPIAGIMLLDRSGSMKPNLELEVRAAETFIHGMLAEDRLRIGNFGKDIVIEPDDFTSDRDALFKVLHGDLQRDGPTPLWNAIDRAIDKLLLEKSRRVVLALSESPVGGFDKGLRDELSKSGGLGVHVQSGTDPGHDVAVAFDHEKTPANRRSLGTSPGLRLSSPGADFLRHSYRRAARPAGVPYATSARS